MLEVPNFKPFQTKALTWPLQVSYTWLEVLDHIFPHVLKDQPTLHREHTFQNLLGQEDYIIFFICFFECWKFPTSNPFKPKYSHWPGRSHTHSLGSQIISSHMCPKISQHYIENKHFRTPWVKMIILFVYILF